MTTTALWLVIVGVGNSTIYKQKQIAALTAPLALHIAAFVTASLSHPFRLGPASTERVGEHQPLELRAGKILDMYRTHPGVGESMTRFEFHG